MAAFLLDTSALLAHYRGEGGADQVQDLLSQDGADIFIASVSVAEFARVLTNLGADSAQARETALAYAALVTKVIPIDTVVSIRAFELGVTANARLPLVDAFIAAAALVSGATLVHRDGHFESLGKMAPERFTI